MSGAIFSIPSIHLYINILQITWMISENSLFSLTHKSAILRNFACFWRWKLLKFHTVVSISSSISYLFEKQLVWIDFVASALFRILWNWTFFSKYSCFLIFRLSPPPFLPLPLVSTVYFQFLLTQLKLTFASLLTDCLKKMMMTIIITMLGLMSKLMASCLYMANI